MRYNIGDIVTYGNYDDTRYEVINVNSDGNPITVRNTESNQRFTDVWQNIFFKLVKPTRTKEEILYDKIQYLKEKQDALQRV